jgi:hypothetical protein
MVIWIGLQPAPFFNTMTATVDKMVEEVSIYMPPASEVLASGGLQLGEAVAATTSGGQ